MDSFPFLHLPSLPTSLNSPPYSCLRTCIKSHDTLFHHPLATFLQTHHKILSIIYKAAHDLALTSVSLSLMTFQAPWPFLLSRDILSTHQACPHWGLSHLQCPVHGPLSPPIITSSAPSYSRISGQMLFLQGKPPWHWHPYLKQLPQSAC